MSDERPRLTSVFFDFGDTLWHFPQSPPRRVIDRAMRRRLRALFSLWGVPPEIDPLELHGALLRARIEAERTADAGDLSSPDYVGITRRVAADSDIELANGQAVALWEAQNVGGLLGGRRIFDETHETLQWLLDRGFRVGAITNRAHGGESFLQELRYDGLLGFFEVVASSDQVGWRKPHPALFEYALDAMGVTPAESALVGDRPEADVRGARALGMTAIWIRKVTPPDRVPDGPDETPHYTIAELSELRSLPPLARGPA